MFKNSINLFRIFFRDLNFSQQEENKLHYKFFQISLLLKEEIENIYFDKIDKFIITFGSKEIWLKYYQEGEIPNYHWYKRSGNASILLDYDYLESLDFESKKKFILLEVCDALSNLAILGKQEELNLVIKKIKAKFSSMAIIDTSYIVLKEKLEVKGLNLDVKVVFYFTEKIEINLCVYKDSLIYKSFPVYNCEYGYIEWLITSFKKIEIENNSIILKGSKDINWLPFSFSLDEL